MSTGNLLVEQATSALAMNKALENMRDKLEHHVEQVRQLVIYASGNVLSVRWGKKTHLILISMYKFMLCTVNLDLV